MVPDIKHASYPTPSEIRDEILRAVRVAHERRGLTVNIRPGSDRWNDAEAFARIVSIAFANNQISVQDVSPLRATGENLKTLCRLFGVPERGPTGSSGYALAAVGSGSVVLPAGYSATAQNGLRYTVVTSVVVANGDPFQMVASDTGQATDLAPGATLSWDSAAIGLLKPSFVVDSAGFTGGTDGDTEESLRARLIDRLAFPPGGGNWPQIKGWAEGASAAVSRAWVYQAIRGPGSYDVAVAGASGDGVLGSSVVETVKGAILAQMPGLAGLHVTTIYPEGVDVVVGIALPLPQSAGGAGGGWRDTTPYPAELTRITAVTGQTITVDSVAAPRLGSSIAIWNPTAKTMVEFVVATAPAGGAGAWVFDIGPASASFVQTGMYVSAGAYGLVSYAQAAAAAFKLGPGEKTDSTLILPRARRRPESDVEDPAALSNVQLLAVSSGHPEIADIAYLARRATGTLFTKTSPSIPPASSDPPRRLVLENLAFVKL